MTAYLHGAAVLTGDGLRHDLGVVLHAGRIEALAATPPAGATPVALPAGALLAPGLIDIQVNGGGGVLFNDTPTAAGAARIAAAHRALGTTAVLPTLITDRAETMRDAGEAIREALRAGVPGVLGVHFEGPFLSPARPGIHDPANIRAAQATEIAWLAEFARTLGAPTLVTLAPECVDDAAIAAWHAAGIVLSAGHSEADFARVAASPTIAAVTHLFNAMPAPAARAPGLAGAALVLDRLYACLIADGVHVVPAMLDLAFRAKPRERVVLVSDAMPVAGTDLGEFSLAGRRILRREGRLTDDSGTLAGADLSLAEAVRNVVRLCNVAPETAIAAASTNPAALLGVDADRGRIAPGYRADFTLFDEALGVTGTWVGGEFAPAGAGTARPAGGASRQAAR